jgi:DNA-binding NarL/FixJ family response regulator
VIEIVEVWIDRYGEAFVQVAGAPGRLSDKERQVLRGVADGLTNAEIGRRLFLAETTVKTYVARLRQRLRARDRANAVHLAWRAGLLR